MSKVQKRKNQRQPGAPHKPLGAYMLFCSDRRPIIMKENPEIKITEIAKIMGAQWKALDAKTQETYKKKAENDKQRYVEEYERYQNGERFPDKRQKTTKEHKSKKEENSEAENSEAETNEEESEKSDSE